MDKQVDSSYVKDTDSSPPVNLTPLELSGE